MGDFLGNVSKGVKVPAEITKTALEPAAREIGVGLGNLFNLVFAPLEKARINKDHKIKIFKTELEERLKTIPSENLVEAPLNIVGPALEAAKFYIEDGDVRSLFIKLISSSMDIATQPIVHPAYVEIIKQLSPFDARNLSYLFRNIGKVASAQINMSEIGEQGYKVMMNYFFPIEGINKFNFTHYESSFNNILRLGLLQMDTNLRFSNDILYESIRNHPFLKQAQIDLPDKRVSIKETFWEFSYLGLNFGHCCIGKDN